jgi:hypothetical protein
MLEDSHRFTTTWDANQCGVCTAICAAVCADLSHFVFVTSAWLISLKYLLAR